MMLQDLTHDSNDAYLKTLTNFCTFVITPPLGTGVVAVRGDARVRGDACGCEGERGLACTSVISPPQVLPHARARKPAATATR
jgi:hypothetical protein